MLHLSSWMTTLPMMLIGMTGILLVIGFLVLVVMALNCLAHRLSLIHISEPTGGSADLPGRFFSQAQTAPLLPDSSPGVLPGGVEVLLGGHAVLLFEGAEKVVVTAKAAGLVHLGDGQPLLDEGAAAV